MNAVSIIIFVMIVFSAMFLVGGTAVDLARHENLRATMQYNLDRAVLAAASLKQTQDPNAVVADYMNKVNTIEEFTLTVSSDIGINSRSVSATATAELETWFLSMAGINSMPVIAASAAQEKIPNLEISLVLDVSGSMGWNNKLPNLKVAAKEFVTTMLSGADPDTVALSIIPFNNGVAPSESIFNALTVNETHDYSTCLQFDDVDFQSVLIDPAVSQEQSVYTSTRGGWENFEQNRRTCYTDAYFEILPYSQNEAALHAKIDSLQANGWTAGHLGIKWGNALLDPAFQSVTTSLISAGDVDAGFAGLPVAYTEVQTLKVIIMMGDGANTYEFLFGSGFRGAGSALWEVVSAQPAAYYLHKASNNNYFDIENDDWLTQSEFNTLSATIPGWISSTQMTWEDAWGHMPAEWYDSIVGGDNAYDDLVYGTARNSSEADAVMSDACNASELAGIVVYTIGFETSASTSAKLEACASTSSHYYDAQGTEISLVFSAIASSIQKLKLTQ